MPLASWQYPCSPSSTSTCSLCCISRCCTSCKDHIKQIIWPTYIRKRSAQLMKLQRFKLISSLKGFTGCWWSIRSFARIASSVKKNRQKWHLIVFPTLLHVSASGCTSELSSLCLTLFFKKFFSLNVTCLISLLRIAPLLSLSFHMLPASVSLLSSSPNSSAMFPDWLLPWLHQSLGFLLSLSSELQLYMVLKNSDFPIGTRD